MQPIVHHVFAAGLIIRLICSIGLGTVSASLILGKLAAYPRQNGCHWCYANLAESSEHCSRSTGFRARNSGAGFTSV